MVFPPEIRADRQGQLVSTDINLGLSRPKSKGFCKNKSTTDKKSVDRCAPGERGGHPGGLRTMSPTPIAQRPPPGTRIDPQPAPPQARHRRPPEPPHRRQRPRLSPCTCATPTPSTGRTQERCSSTPQTLEPTPDSAGNDGKTGPFFRSFDLPPRFQPQNGAEIETKRRLESRRRPWSLRRSVQIPRDFATNHREEREEWSLRAGKFVSNSHLW